jgi:hypothetical protein
MTFHQVAEAIMISTEYWPAMLFFVLIGYNFKKWGNK